MCALMRRQGQAFHELKRWIQQKCTLHLGEAVSSRLHRDGQLILCMRIPDRHLTCGTSIQCQKLTCMLHHSITRGLSPEV